MESNTMACHQHRCCRRPVSIPADGRSVDYVLLAAHDESVVEGAATVLRGAGASPERHDLGLRVNCRGERWRAALAHLSETLAAPARRALRVALIPVAADPLAFQRALLMSQPLDAFARALELTHENGAMTRPARAAMPNHLLGDLFKGDALE
jgi:hypothetical protein